jgi:DNA polymerase-3 subunit delta
MNIFTRDELRTKLKSGEIAPLYLLFGSERYLRNQAAKAITEKALADSPLREFNESEFSLGETGFVNAIGSAEQLPMVSPLRVVRILDVHKLKEEDEEALIHYVSRPAETSVVIFIGDELDKRKRVVKKLLETCVVVEFTDLSDGDLLNWAKVKMKELGVTSDERTLRQIVALVGSDALKLTNEIEKLATAALPEKIITFELVEQLVPNSRELTSFELTDHINNRNRAQACRLLKKLLDDGAEPLMLLGLIANNFHRLSLAKEMIKDGVSADLVARAVNLPFFKKEAFLASARRADERELAKRLQRIAVADESIKTSKATPRMQIEMLVIELCT